MLNNIDLKLIFILIIFYGLCIYSIEPFSQKKADKFYEPDLCGPQFCNLGNWSLPFDIKLDNKYLGYSMVGSCKSGCRARKLNLNINKKVL